MQEEVLEGVQEKAPHVVSRDSGGSGADILRAWMPRRWYERGEPAAGDKGPALVDFEAQVCRSAARWLLHSKRCRVSQSWRRSVRSQPHRREPHPSHLRGATCPRSACAPRGERA